MIQGKNPITQNPNVRFSEVGSGHVAADVDSGLIYGTVQLPFGTDPDLWFSQITGEERPDSYKADLQKIVDAGESPGQVPDNLLQSVKDVLDEGSDTSVLVTTLNSINYGDRFGVPNSQSIQHLSLKPHDINVGGLPIRNNFDEEHPQQDAIGAVDTSSTRAARRSADKLRPAAEAQGDADSELANKPAGTTGPVFALDSSKDEGAPVVSEGDGDDTEQDEEKTEGEGAA